VLQPCALEVRVGVADLHLVCAAVIAGNRQGARQRLLAQLGVDHDGLTGRDVDTKAGGEVRQG
jgi:hypothetical protein